MNTALARPGAIPFRIRLRARLIRLALVLTAITSITILAGCNSAANLIAPPTGPLVTVRHEGGMCMDGPCDYAIVLERDGRVLKLRGEEEQVGRINADAYSALDLAIQSTDFAAMRAKPFTDECPIAFDGVKQIFEFSIGGTVQELDSCESALDWSSPLFIAVVGALGEWIQAPLILRR